MTAVFCSLARAARSLAAIAAVVVAIAAMPSGASAQNQIYSPDELTVAPKIASPTEVARLVRATYPENLRRAGVNGTVEVEFVVGVDGKVESQSVEVIAASPPALGAAAKHAVQQFKFKPGQVKGQNVRTRVALPLVYRAT